MDIFGVKREQSNPRIWIPIPTDYCEDFFFTVTRIVDEHRVCTNFESCQIKNFCLLLVAVELLGLVQEVSYLDNRILRLLL